MRHVKQIRDIVDQGEIEEAHEALDQLLSLGPHNTEALKLRAELFEQVGRFADEETAWERVAEVDNEDPEAIHYLLRRQLEEREHFYFTDDIPGVGRRFMAYPRSLIRNAALGLAGCATFIAINLVLERRGQEPLQSTYFTFFLFGLLIVVPWIMISWSYVRSMKWVAVGREGIGVAGRFRSWHYNWEEVKSVYLAHSRKIAEPYLSLVLVPKDEGKRPVEIDLKQHSTAIRARSYLIREIARMFREPEYIAIESVDIDRSKSLTF